ncbi:unnamed protein product [Lepeophtheirus salmonis]|uniref:(salmon louse) hypothetical protein n=1 Tax=Lepeophtheirus salmonis TaxID=72036 RepID=A0A7R8GZA0_LEPSM|nr:unnamed protein product [Lepeophtheirus salmonis]CAF2760535.1 unnamed protein product [Lepeophtheirus salmonis]
MLGLGRLPPPHSPSASNINDNNASNLSGPIRSFGRSQESLMSDTEDIQVLRQIRFQFERNQISRSDVDKLQIFELLNDHLSLEDTDECMNSVIINVIPCLKSKKSGIRRLAVDILVTYSKLTMDVQGFIRSILQNGLESMDHRISKETLALIPYLFTPQSLSTFREKNIYLLVAGLGRKLKYDNMRRDAWNVLRTIGETVGPQRVSMYISKLGHEPRQIYENLSMENESQNNDTAGGVVGHKLASKGWFEYGAIDTGILSKLKDDENIRIRLQGADELNKAIKAMKDLNALLPQMRAFLNFLDSTLEEEQNFKMNLIILEIYGVIIDKLKSYKIKPHLRTICSSLIKTHFKSEYCC